MHLVISILAIFPEPVLFNFPLRGLGYAEKSNK